MRTPLPKTWQDDLRILWAITRKDIRESILNKNVIALILSALFIVGMYRALPVLEQNVEPPLLRIYDAGESALVAFLENDASIDVRTYSSLEKLQASLRHTDIPQFGLVIPAGFDQAIETGQVVHLEGYRVNWLSPQQADELQRYWEAKITRLLDQPVALETAGNIVYLEPDSGGLGVTAGMAIIFAMVMIGLTLIPHTMLEEKKQHTLEMMLVSPASSAHVVMAKALTGLFYSLLGAGIGLGVNAMLVQHWWLAGLAVVCGSLFAVSMGLLLGNLVDDRAQLTLLAWAFIMPLFLPLILFLLEELLPAWLVPVMKFVPSTVAFNLLRSSFALEFDWGAVVGGIGWLLAWSAGITLLTAWVLNRKATRSTEQVVGLGPWLAQALPALGRSRATAAPATGAMPVRGDLPVSTAGEPRLFTLESAALPRIGPARGLQIVVAIAAKDIREAIRNRTLLAIMLGVGVMILSGIALPLLLGLRDTPALVVYDPGRSTILSGLAAGEDFRLRLADSEEEMRTLVSTAPEVALGLVLASDFDQQAGSGETLTLTGYYVHWADTEEVARLIGFFEDVLSQGSWGEVEIRPAEGPLYPGYENEGFLAMNTQTLVVAVLTIGLVLVPILIIEEKESHTFQTLLVSPARMGHVIAGKAIAGMAYCLAAALVVVLFSGKYIVHWPVAILTLLLVSVFAVGVGILLGLLAESQAALSLWSGLTLLFLLSAGMAQFFNTSTWAGWVQTVLSWIPTTSAYKLLNLALAGEFPPGLLWRNMAMILAAILLVYLLALALLRRSDR